MDTVQPSAIIDEILTLADQLKAPVQRVSRQELDNLARGNQGIALEVGRYPLVHVQDILDRAAKLEESAFIVILDHIEDPHNLGAIIRTANAAGADAVIVPERRAAGMTETVAKAAAGAIEYVPVVRAGNVTRTLEDLKKRGFWIYGLDERGTEAYDRVDYAAASVIVLGGEGKGLHQLVREHCDVLVRIPMAGTIPSLNVSVAAGIVLFEWKRRQGF